jgi:Clp amino terminal domain, pathogenicity island component
MFERFTTAARETVQRARGEAIAAHRRHIGTEHLLIALLATDRGVAYGVLSAAGLTAEGVRVEALRLVPPPADPLGPADAEALRAIGIDLDAVIASVEGTFGEGALRAPEDDEPRRRRGLFRRGAVVPAGSHDNPRFSPRAKKVLELSLREALRRGDDYIGAEHILLGLIREGDGLAAKILTDTGLSLDALRTGVDRGLDDAA